MATKSAAIEKVLRRKYKCRVSRLCDSQWKRKAFSMIEEAFGLTIPLFDDFVTVFGVKLPKENWSGKFLVYPMYSVILINMSHEDPLMTLIHECGHFLDWVINTLSGNNFIDVNKLEAEGTAMMIQSVVMSNIGKPWNKSIMPDLYLSIAEDLETKDASEMIEHFRNRWKQATEKNCHEHI